MFIAPKCPKFIRPLGSILSVRLPVFETPLPFVGPFAAIFWVTYVWAFYISEWRLVRRSKQHVAKSSDWGSLRNMAIIMFVAQVFAFVFAFVNVMQFSPGSLVALFWVGVSFLLAGSALRLHCFRMLGEHFTGDLRAQTEQPIISRGAYAWIRHPGYAAAILMFFGVGLALGSWVSLSILSIAAAVVYLRRIVMEERLLVEVLGERYRLYMRDRKRLIPFVY